MCTRPSVLCPTPKDRHPRLRDQGVRQSIRDETVDSETEAKTETSTGLQTEPDTLGDIWQNLHC